MIKYSCPICDKIFYDTTYFPHVPSTSWSDDCACCDQNYCLAHQFGSEDLPIRPSEVVLERRAEERCIRNKTREEENINRIKARYEKLKNSSDLLEKIKEFLGDFDTICEFKSIINKKSMLFLDQHKDKDIIRFLEKNSKNTGDWHSVIKSAIKVHKNIKEEFEDLTTNDKTTVKPGIIK